MKYIYKINEFRNQLEIPFDNKHPLYDKPPHIHLIDRLEDISNELKIKPENYSSNWTIYDIEKTWNKYFDSALKIFLNEHDIFYSDDSFYYDGICAFLDEYDIIDNQDLFNDEIVNYIIENPDCDSMDIIEKFDLYTDLSEYINSDEKLKDINNKILEKIFYNRLDEMDVLSIIQENMTGDGLIPVYRAISFDTNGDIFSELKKEYQGVGIYWSYKLEKAEPHGGSKNNTFVLYGMIKPEYINWGSTIYKSAYVLNEENEIEILEDMPILINKITEYRGDKLILKKEIIVKT